MKKYLITERQLNEMKKFLDDLLSERDLKFLVEDIETLALDVKLEDYVKCSDAAHGKAKVFVAVYAPKEGM